jgi:hypothetical protein
MIDIDPSRPYEPNKRIQRQRTKGWRMPEGAVYVGRPSRWGNPYFVPGRLAGRHDGIVYSLEMGFAVNTRHDSVRAFRQDVASWTDAHRDAWLAPLRGRDLACWCPLDQPCHADVLLELANR